MTDLLKFADGTSIEDELKDMTMQEIMNSVPEVPFRRADGKKCRHLLQTVSTLSKEDQDVIRVANQVAREGEAMEIDVEEQRDDFCGKFMQPASQEAIQKCLEHFIDATGNSAVAKMTCMVCAREMATHEVQEQTVMELPNRHLLVPNKHHPAHELIKGMLLERSAIKGKEGLMRGSICLDCTRWINKKKIPPLALANNMWIGAIPTALSVLTLPEKILVARYFPAAYIVKLFPKQKGAKHWPTSGLHSGIQGNVSTYKLNTDEIADMVDTDVMPPPAKILASTIGVTIIGPKNAPERTMPDFLRVRRDRIRTALMWLKENNPLYVNVQISEKSLAELPVNDIPLEILGAVRSSDRTDQLEKEHAGYVVNDEDVVDEEDECGGYAGGIRSIDESDDDIDDDHLKNIEPEVVPLQSLGVVDVGASDVADQDILAHAMANIARSDLEGSFAVKRGSQFVNEYPRTDKNGIRTDGGPDNPHHLMGAFPVLYPYAEGGIETDRPIPVSYAEHARWALQYWDKRFRTDLHFVFQVFGVLQKRQVCNSAGLQIKRKDFMQSESAIRSLKPADLFQAAGEESRRVPFSNPAVKSLRKHLSSVRSKVMGTDESRVGIRSKIWSLTVELGPPSLWITINPADTCDPIAQVLAGADIDLDNFDQTSGPNSSARTATIAADPFAAASFFHLIIDAVLQELFGVKAHSKNSHVETKPGIFGNMSGYIGTIEAQGRGTLHFHVIGWLRDAPTSSRMKELLQGLRFRQRIVDYIKVSIKSDLGGANGKQLKSMHRQKAVSYSRPQDPRNKDYEFRSRRAENVLARAVQMHSCSRSSCLQLVRGNLKCKRNAPFPVSNEDWVDEDGSWGSKRTYGYLNAWAPALMQAVRANQDVKLITNGVETKDISWYITNYVAKKQKDSSNCSALLAKRIAFHKVQERYNADMAKRNKRLIQRCANTLSREQEFSAPEATSYVMALGDRKISHHFVTMFTGELNTALKKTFPNLRYKRFKGTVNVKQKDSANQTTNNATLNDDLAVEREPFADDECAMITVVDGQLQLCNNLKEYADRGELLEDYCLVDFLKNTYDGRKLKSSTKNTKKGNHASIRSDYKSDDGKKQNCRILRQGQHQTMVEYVGSWFPRNDDIESREMYCTTMLALQVPWRTLACLLKPGLSVTETFDSFVATATTKQQEYMHNAQYFYECSDGARRQFTRGEPTNIIHAPEDSDMVIDENVENEGNYNESQDSDVDEEEIEDAISNPFTPADCLFAEVAMNIAEDMGIFASEESCPSSEASQLKLVSRASQEHFEQYEAWRNSMDSAVQIDIDMDTSDETDIINQSAHSPMDIDPSVDAISSRLINDFTHVQALNIEQRRAHDIVIQNLDAHLNNQNPPQLLMQVIGCGGTGKTQLLNAITTSFNQRKIMHLLAKTAMSGVAASLIGGSTLHLWAGLPVGNLPQGDEWMNRSSKEIKSRREANISSPLCLVIDEMGMLTTDTLTYLSQLLGIVRTGDGRTDSTVPMGGMNLILTGDFHQFPPVANANVSLYSSQAPRISSMVGQNLYSQFTTVVELVKQWRITDLVWLEILQNARNGTCSADDIFEIRKLILTTPGCNIPDFTLPPWNDAILITPRNCVRAAWNHARLREHCKWTKNILYIVDAEDTAGRDRRPLSSTERLTMARGQYTDKKRLGNRLEIAIGMKAMITDNILTKAGLANGSRGTITEIVLDTREQSINADIVDDTVRLQYPPSMVLIQLDYICPFPTLPGLKPGQFPIFPSESKFTIGDKKKKVTITRRQFPLTPAYAFTDHKAQGQTMGFVIVDIGCLKKFPVNQFAAYVALSRSKGRDTIRLLRDFEDELFTKPPAADLQDIDSKLARLVQDTKEKWDAGVYKYN